MMMNMVKTFLSLVAAAFIVLMVSGCLPAKEYRIEKRIHTVAAGQTVWGIATKWQEQQDKRMSTGEFVHNIYKINHIDAQRYIQPGDRLVIPLVKEVKEK